MNCRAGDLAVVVKTAMSPNMLGAFVRVIQPYDGPFKWNEPAWWFDFGGRRGHGPDSFLRPVRGTPVASKRESQTA